MLFSVGNPTQGSHKNLKIGFRDFSMTDLLLSMTPILTWFQIWLWLCLTTWQSQTRKLPQPWEQAIPWLFHDFLGSFHIPRLFHDFPRQQFFPGFSMTMGTLPTPASLSVCPSLEFAGTSMIGLKQLAKWFTGSWNSQAHLLASILTNAPRLGHRIYFGYVQPFNIAA